MSKKTFNVGDVVSITDIGGDHSGFGIIHCISNDGKTADVRAMDISYHDYEGIKLNSLCHVTGKDKHLEERFKNYQIHGIIKDAATIYTEVEKAIRAAEQESKPSAESATTSISSAVDAIYDIIRSKNVKMLIDIPTGTSDANVINNISKDSVIQVYILIEGLIAVIKKFQDKCDSVDDMNQYREVLNGLSSIISKIITDLINE